MLRNLRELPLSELRQMWAKAWNHEPHARIGRTMLEKSLKYKTWERENSNLTPEQQTQLKHLAKEYKCNPACFDGNGPLKPGTRLVRKHNGKKHNVLVKADGFEYDGKTYKSLSKIANKITGKNWNGWVFFGIKKVGA